MSIFDESLPRPDGKREGAELKVSADEDEWMYLARQAYEGSTDYWEANYYKRWERNISLFQSRHPAGSKFHTDSYKNRSKIFRPKTRAAIRKNEAAATMAFFSTDDVVSVTAENDAEPLNQLVAEIRGELLNYRLTNKTNGVNWFPTCLGAYQDTMVMGACVSYQHWQYEEKFEMVEEQAVDPYTGLPKLDDMGAPIMVDKPKSRIVKDKPAIDLLPLENVRFDPAANWMDPINTSPYVIRLVPMYVHEVEERMSKTLMKTGEPEWYHYDRQDMYSSRASEDYNPVRHQRQGTERRDPKDDSVNRVHIRAYDIVWVHENFVRKDGEDWVFYTLGTSKRLSDPKPMGEVYLHGERPLVFGFCVLETHKTVPSGLVELAEGVQLQANEIANQRLDNVKLVLNKRYFIARSGQVDIRSLMRNVPGSATAMKNPNEDVRIVETPDVTASSYAEQDRLNVDFDEVMGQFSASSVQSNRQMNETVGGLSLLTQGANQLTEYQIRVFAETWVEPVMRQIDLLEQAYETDENVLSIVGNKSRIWKKYKSQLGMDTVPAQLLEGNVKVSVNVGFGATDPQRRIEKLAFGLQTVAAVSPEAVQRLKVDELIKEVFGILGYQDGARFFDGMNGEVDPKIQQLMDQVQQLTQIIESEQHKEEAKVKAQAELEKVKGEITLNIEKMRADLARELESPKKDMKMMELAAQERVVDKQAESTVRVARLNKSVDLEKMDHTMMLEQMRQQAQAGEAEKSRQHQANESSAGREHAEHLKLVDSVNNPTDKERRNEAVMTEVIAAKEEATKKAVLEAEQKFNELKREMEEEKSIHQKEAEVVDQLLKAEDARKDMQRTIMGYLAKNGTGGARRLIERLK